MEKHDCLFLSTQLALQAGGSEHLAGPKPAGGVLKAGICSGSVSPATLPLLYTGIII